MTDKDYEYMKMREYFKKATVNASEAGRYLGIDRRTAKARYGIGKNGIAITVLAERVTKR